MPPADNLETADGRGAILSAARELEPHGIYLFFKHGARYHDPLGAGAVGGAARRAGARRPRRAPGRPRGADGSTATARARHLFPGADRARTRSRPIDRGPARRVPLRDDPRRRRPTVGMDGPFGGAPHQVVLPRPPRLGACDRDAGSSSIGSTRIGGTRATSTPRSLPWWRMSVSEEEGVVVATLNSGAARPARPRHAAARPAGAALLRQRALRRGVVRRRGALLDPAACQRSLRRGSVRRDMACAALAGGWA